MTWEDNAHAVGESGGGDLRGGGGRDRRRGCTGFQPVRGPGCPRRSHPGSSTGWPARSARVAAWRRPASSMPSTKGQSTRSLTAWSSSQARTDIPANVIGYGDVQKPLLEISPADFLQPIINAHAVRSSSMTRAVARHMIRRGSAATIAFGGNGPQTLPGLGGFKVALDAVEGLAPAVGSRARPTWHSSHHAENGRCAGIDRRLVRGKGRDRGGDSEGDLAGSGRNVGRRRKCGRIRGIRSGADHDGNGREHLLRGADGLNVWSSNSGSGWAASGVWQTEFVWHLASSRRPGSFVSCLSVWCPQVGQQQRPNHSCSATGTVADSTIKDSRIAIIITRAGDCGLAAERVSGMSGGQENQVPTGTMSW